MNKKYSKAFMKRARAYEKLGKKEECLQGNHVLFFRIKENGVNKFNHIFVTCSIIFIFTEASCQTEINIHAPPPKKKIITIQKSREKVRKNKRKNKTNFGNVMVPLQYFEAALRCTCALILVSMHNLSV